MATLFSSEQFHAVSKQVTEKPQTLRIRQLISILCLSIPILGPMLWLIWDRTPNVPVADEWQIVDVIGKFDSGTLGANDLWSDWNGHRIVVPRVIEMLLGEITHYDRHIMMTANTLIIVVAAVLLLRCIEQTSASPIATITYGVPLFLLLFSLGQFENWMNPFQIAFVATVFGVVLCMWGITMHPASSRGLTIAIIGGLIASLSSLVGLMVWAIFLPVLWTAGFRRRWQYVLWIAIAALIILPYRVGLSAQTSVSHDFGNLFRYFLAFLGAPIGWPEIAHAQLFAVISLFVFGFNLVMYWRLRGSWRSITIWLALACFALGCAALTAIGRVSFGINQALQSRYQSLAALWWIALTALVWLTLSLLFTIVRRSSSGVHRAIACRTIAAVNLVMVVGLSGALIQQNIVGFHAGDTWLSTLLADQHCVFNYATAPDACLRGFLPPESLRGRAAYLDQHNMAAFSSHHPVKIATLPLAKESTLYGIDTVSQTPVVNLTANKFPIAFGAPIVLQGWAVDGPQNALAGGVFVSIDGSHEVLADYGGNRPDVATHYGVPAYQHSAFSVRVPTTDLAFGNHTLIMKIVANNMLSYYATLPVNIVVMPLQDVPRAPNTTRSAALTAGIEQQAPDQTQPIHIPPKSPVIISGWAIDEHAVSPASGVVFTVDGKTDFPADYGADRPDVAQFWKNSAYRYSGYVVSLSAERLGPGTHTLTMKVLVSGAQAYDEPSWSAVVIIPAT